MELSEAILYYGVMAIVLLTTYLCRKSLGKTASFVNYILVLAYYTYFTYGLYTNDDPSISIAWLLYPIFFALIHIGCVLLYMLLVYINKKFR